MQVLHLTTLDSVFLIITACAISLFFIIGVVLAAAALVLVGKIRKVVKKAEDAIGSVEEATATIRHIGDNASGPLAMIKVVKNIMEIVKKR